MRCEGFFEVDCIKLVGVKFFENIVLIVRRWYELLEESSGCVEVNDLCVFVVCSDFKVVY